MVSWSTRRLRVLVVEDEPLVAMVIEDALEAMGHEVVGPIALLSEAVETATSQAIDCAILDINIRGGLSYPVAEILLQQGRPILFATGYRDWTLPDGLSSQRFMAKPYSQDILEQEIQLLCDRVV